ncbi:Hpt domain-containing protein [Vibrio kyushuensis]|uniref:Hpt domain-containing protein n=1 Tax=Vibrio kyushuensis TaxID=2910249 RepID=UPI003D106E78
MSKESMNTMPSVKAVQSMKTKQKQLSAIVGIWLTVILSIVMLTRTNLENLSSVEELGNSLEELRSTLYLDTQYRMKHADDISLKIQLIYSLRLQLESSYEGSYFQPDINQLIFTTDRFIELVKQFNDSEVEVIELVDRLKTIRDSYQQQPEIQALYYQLSTRVFEAMFSHSSASPEIYRSLDYLFVQSQLMSPEDGEKLQLALAQTSSVLGGYAKGSYLVEKLINHPVNMLQSEIRDQYDELAQRYFMIVTLTSALAMFLLSMILMKKTNIAWVDEGLTTNTIETNVPSGAVVDTNETANRNDSGAAGSTARANSTSMPLTTDIQTEKIVYEDGSAQAPMNSSNSIASSDTVPIDKLDKRDSKEYELNEIAVDDAQTMSSPEVNIDYMLQCLNDDKESVLLLLDVFIQDHEDDAKELPSLLKSDMEHAMRKAHSLKGVAANLGAELLKEVATLIESDIKDEIEVSEQKLEQLVTALSSTIESAKVYIENNQ